MTRATGGAAGGECSRDRVSQTDGRVSRSQAAAGTEN